MGLNPARKTSNSGVRGKLTTNNSKELNPLSPVRKDSARHSRCRRSPGACGVPPPLLRTVMRRPKQIYDGGGSTEQDNKYRSSRSTSSHKSSKMKTALLLLGLTTTAPQVSGKYITSPFGEKIDLLEALGVKHPRSAVKRTKGYCSSKNPDNSQQDYAYQLLKKHQISVPTSSIFVEEDGTQRPFPEEFSIVSVLKLKKQKKNSNLFTVWDSNGRQQLGLNIGKDHRLYYQDDEMSGNGDNKYKKLPGTKKIKTHDGNWHKVAWSVTHDDSVGKTKSELYIDCTKVSEIWFERSQSPQMSTG